MKRKGQRLLIIKSNNNNSADNTNNKKATAMEKGRRYAKRNLFPTNKWYKAAFIVMSVIMAAFLIATILVDAIPGDLLLILVAVLIALLIGSTLLFASKHRWKRIIGVLLALVFISFTAFATNFLGNTYAMMDNISDTGIEATGPTAKAVDTTRETFNLYITGIDQWTSEKGLDLERSDVNMILTVNPLTKKVLLTSIPRDTYVKLHTAKQMDKLTHTGIYGVDETLNSVEDWLDIDINYYVKMNFTGARDIINAMGGIEVYSPVDFTSSIKGYEYHKGWNVLGGKEALYFARERKSFEGQDAIRVENQQRVIEAVIKKMTSSTTLLTRYADIMEAAGSDISTNLTTNEMTSLAKMQIVDLADWDVVTQKIEGKVDQDYVASLTQTQKFDIYRPSDESVQSCKNEIIKVMNPTEEEIENAKKSNIFVVNAVKRALNKEKDDTDVNLD